MNKRRYNKLVRDKIPQIIRDNGGKCTTRILEEEEYKVELINKLYEEIQEFNDQWSEEKLADILEVLHGIAAVKDYEMMHIDYIRMNKREKRGGFEGRVLLVDIED
ncbi:MAG TPA: nucleoside triphosphate pyrophosphohydrolase [Eubacteriaceae bacterium]|nr:nucleoside triphosphate pyrophosphohydrolase [Eubacteriaceae bacterium]